MDSSKLPRGLYVVADPRFLAPGTDFLDYVSALAHARAPTIQLRMKNAPVSQIMETARRMAKIRRKHRFYFVVNDYPEIAREVGANAVHVGKADAPVDQVRAIVGDQMAFGYSNHSKEEAMRAAEFGADYVAFGAIFPTAAKGPDHPIQNLAKLREVVVSVSKPVVAIGGINRSNVKEVWATGIHAVAMITGISQATDIEAEVAWYQKVLR